MRCHVVIFWFQGSSFGKTMNSPLNGDLRFWNFVLKAREFEKQKWKCSQNLVLNPTCVKAPETQEECLLLRLVVRNWSEIWRKLLLCLFLIKMKHPLQNVYIFFTSTISSVADMCNNKTNRKTIKFKVLLCILVMCHLS